MRDRAKQREYQRRWRRENPDRVREHGRRTRAKHPDRVRACKRKWEAENRERHLARRREWARKDRLRNPHRERDANLARYGITTKEYLARLDAQYGLCAICDRPETRLMRGKVKWMAVDHDHATGRVRGLICHDCNSVLALCHDNAETLRRAAEYLVQDRKAEGW